MTKAKTKKRRSRSRKVCFTITGEALTRLTRDLVCEGKWPEAVRTLVDGMHGMTYELAFRVLAGDAKFVGENNSVDLVDDDDQEYRGRLLWLYAGIYRDASRNTYLQPYAFVSGWSAQDLGGAPGGLTNKHRRQAMQRRGPLGTSWESADDKLYRSQHYMDDPVNDWAEVLYVDEKHDQRCVLLRSVAQPPLWVEPHFDLQSALNAWLKYHELEERSALRGPFYDDAIDERREIREQAQRRREKPDKQTREKIRKQTAAALATDSPFTPDEAETILEGISGEADVDSVPERGNPEDSKHGYILRDGSFYPCKYMQHKALATRLLKHLHSVETDDPDKEADKRGWVKVQIGMLDKMARVMAVRRMTEVQRKIALEWCVAHNAGPEALQELMTPPER